MVFNVFIEKSRFGGKKHKAMFFLTLHTRSKGTAKVYIQIQMIPVIFSWADLTVWDGEKINIERLVSIMFPIEEDKGILEEYV